MGISKDTVVAKKNRIFERDEEDGVDHLTNELKLYSSVLDIW
jgi:hypothetical protein